MFEEVDEMVRDERYIDATLAIARAIGVPYEDDFPVTLKSVFLSYLGASGCSRQELFDCLSEDAEEVIAFSLKKYEFLEGSPDEQEYPEGEEPGADDADELLEKGPIGPAFLIGSLCEFFLIKHRSRADLAAYLKRLRMPRQRKYARDLERIFGEVHGT